MAIRYLSNFDSDGTSLGQSITDKVSLYGETPVAQRASASQAAVATTGSTKTTPAGFTTTTQANAIVTQLNAVIALLKAAGTSGHS